MKAEDVLRWVNLWCASSFSVPLTRISWNRVSSVLDRAKQPSPLLEERAATVRRKVILFFRHWLDGSAMIYLLT